jgi:serine/threonine protein kinase/tetratricopeptide (TPR) repeat protein
VERAHGVNKAMKSTTTQIKSDPARWQRLKHILADALEKTSQEDRMVLVRQLCADDTTLLREAKKLLALDTTIFEDFAELAAKNLRSDEPNRVGERMGAYAMIKELGHGGMGAVYLAERADGEFEKRVAIKVLKRGTDTDEVLRRFRIERQILANLEHPNITRLLDAGTTADGLPYLVMEFIEGTPITRFVQRENIDLRGRLTLFLKVCSAVALAHKNQVIHRDIKPSNVLISRDGEPKLLDFGIAKLLSVDSNDDGTTVAIERRLTPVYAAPEQHAGRPATNAADVYSLGVLLYELMTDERPCVTASGNVLKKVESKHLRERQPADGVALGPKTEYQLSSQLNRIVRRATQRDPAERYCSVADLSEDLKRCLSRAPLQSAVEIGHRWYNTAAVLAAIVIAALVLLRVPSLRWLRKDSIANTSSAQSRRPLTDTVHSIAVLPFEPLGRDAGDELLGLGMADAVIGRMSNLKGLVVLPTSAISKYEGRSNEPRVAGRTLAVDAILTGTVQRTGDQVRVTVQLVHVASGRTIWSEKFDQTFTDIFGIQDAISDKVARSLVRDRSKKEERQLFKHYATGTAAYEAYLTGLFFWNKRSKDGLEKAIDYFEQAVEKDPHFALAYALMADCYYLQIYYGYSSAPDRIQNAKAAAERALLLDDSIGEAHVAAAMVHFYEKDDKAGMDSLRHALTLNPNLAVAHLRYAWSLCSLGRLDEAVREMRRAQELDPLSPTNNTDLGVILGFAHDFPDSLTYCYKAAELEPDSPSIQENLGFAYTMNRIYQEAIEHYQKAAKLNPENRGDVLASVATVLATAGRNAEAEDIMHDLLKLAREGKADPYNMTMLYAARGEQAQAFEWFEKALQTEFEGERGEADQLMIKYHPLLDPLRSDSRFAKLLRRYRQAWLLEKQSSLTQGTTKKGT